MRAIAAADLLIVGGTSLAVYPAAGLLRYFWGQRAGGDQRHAHPGGRRGKPWCCKEKLVVFWANDQSLEWENKKP